MTLRATGAGREIGDGLWIFDGPAVRWFGMPFPTRMTVVRLGDGTLLLHSPIEPSPALVDAVEALGDPRWLVSPNKLHHLFLAGWQQACPLARSFAPPGLRAKRPDLRFDGELGDRPEPAWAAELDQLVFRGSRVLEELVFLHRASRTLVVGDLIENFDPRALAWPQRLLARWGGVLAPRGGTPLDLRQTFRGRHDEARRALRRLLDWQPRAVVMCHGVPVLDDAGPFLDAAFAWLGPPSQASTIAAKPP